MFASILLVLVYPPVCLDWIKNFFNKSVHFLSVNEFLYFSLKKTRLGFSTLLEKKKNCMSFPFYWIEDIIPPIYHTTYVSLKKTLASVSWTGEDMFLIIVHNKYCFGKERWFFSLSFYNANIIIKIYFNKCLWYGHQSEAIKGKN